MNALQSIPLWGYYVVLGVAFLVAHLLSYRPSPVLNRGRRMLGRWSSSLLFLAGLLWVSNESVATVIPALLLATLGGIVSGRTAPPPRSRAPSPAVRSPAEGSDATVSGSATPNEGEAIAAPGAEDERETPTAASERATPMASDANDRREPPPER